MSWRHLILAAGGAFILIRAEEWWIGILGLVCWAGSWYFFCEGMDTD